MPVHSFLTDEARASFSANRQSKCPEDQSRSKYCSVSQDSPNSISTRKLTFNTAQRKMLLLYTVRIVSKSQTGKHYRPNNPLLQQQYGQQKCNEWNLNIFNKI